MKIAFFGLTITSSWGNGHATTYRSLCKALASRGHRITFVEKDVEWYRSNRDMPDPPYCDVVFYTSWEDEQRKLVAVARAADIVVVGSYFPNAIDLTYRLLDADIGPILFYDIDTPITLAALRSGRGGTEYLTSELVPHFATYLSFTGGPALLELEKRFGSPRALPLYCSVDPALYHPVSSRPEFTCDMSYLGTYAADRQPKLEQMLCATAIAASEHSFIVAGPQYPTEVSWPENVQRIIHLSPAEHPAFYSSSRFTLNLTRRDMVVAGFSPSVRLFEASACGAPIISDDWPGLDHFLMPGEEVLVPSSADEVVAIVTGMSDEERSRVGRNARERILASHTAQHRAEQFEEIVASLPLVTSGRLFQKTLQ